jgi:DNA-binding response OmpR family regulator
MSSRPPVILQADRKLGETRMLRTELRRRGAAVAMAETSEQAMRQALLSPPDVIILDDDVGREADRDLVEYFRSTAPEAEVILLSSHADSLTRGIGLGLLFHGVRPVSIPTLLDLIEQALPGRLGPASGPAAISPMVLCVDDDRTTLNSLSRLLHRHGYRVSTFDNPELVLTAIPEVAPDLALVDVAMPGLDGRELSRQIRQQYRGLFPIVMHSARTTDADRWSSFRHGADYYLPKPCEPHQLLDVVDFYADRLDAEERQFLEARM